MDPMILPANGLAITFHLVLGQEFRKLALTGDLALEPQRLSDVTEDLLKVGVVGVLFLEETGQFLGHFFGWKALGHQLASKNDGLSRSSSNSP